MVRRLYACDICHGSYDAEENAKLCENACKRELGKKRHIIYTLNVDVTWGLECAKCKEMFIIKGSYENKNISKLDNVIISCSVCDYVAEVDDYEVCRFINNFS
jgi:hypothetical protein